MIDVEEEKSKGRAKTNRMSDTNCITAVQERLLPAVQHQRELPLLQ